jgi:pathogenesis-related protein 1
MRLLLAACFLATCAAVPGTAADPALRREMLEAHNAARKRVSVDPLAWSDKLAELAQNWASALLMQGAPLIHRPQNPKGENLFEIRGAVADPAYVVNAWVSEAFDYDYRLNACRRGGMCGHYTQVVWRETRRVGCAVARSSTREVWVCNYEPPGNVRGRRPY